MKKLLFFILILCAAGYWGIREGNSSVKDFSPPRAASKSEPRRTEKNWLEELTGRIGTLITTPAVEEGKSNPSLSPDTEDSKKDSSLSTVKEKLGNILHFKESLEARVDRNKFISQKEIPDLLKKRNHRHRGPPLLRARRHRSYRRYQSSCHKLLRRAYPGRRQYHYAADGKKYFSF